MIGICTNHRCPRFEYTVRGVENDEQCCDECGWRLCHESGLTFADAREKGYANAGRVMILPLGDERMKIDIGMPRTRCSCCRRETGPDELSLDLRFAEIAVGVQVGEHDVRICRSCLSEYAPRALAKIEKAAR